MSDICRLRGNDGGSQAPAPVFESVACDPALVPEGQDPANMPCGELTVAENRSHFSGRTVTLAVVVLHATGTNWQPDPLVFLNGGPGDWSIDGPLSRFTADFAAPIQSQRDIILDQRGTGRSQPALNCPEVLPSRDSFAERLIATEEGERDARNRIACHDRLVNEGNDLSAYSSAAMAQDIANLMTAILDDPTHEPDHGCVDALPSPQFAGS